MVFEELDPKTNRDLWILPMDGGGAPKPYLRTPFNEQFAAISPDGKWLAYLSDESGPFEVYVDTFPTPRNRFKVTDRGAIAAYWANDSRELAVISADGRSILVSEVPGGAEFRWTRADARIWLRTRSRVVVVRSWVAHPDAAVRPVTLRIATPCQEILVEELHNERLVSLALELPDDGPLVLLTHVSRTWRPSDHNQLDTRELGAGLAIDYVESLATASDIDRRVRITPCATSAARL